jgi:hypothetical protein
MSSYYFGEPLSFLTGVLSQRTLIIRRLRFLLYNWEFDSQLYTITCNAQKIVGIIQLIIKGMCSPHRS